MTEAMQDNVCHRPGAATISIGKRMYVHQPVMKARRDLFDVPRSILDLKLDVIEKQTQLFANSLGRYSHRHRFLRSDMTGPCPSISEHSPVKYLQEFNFKNLPPPEPKHPCLTTGYVRVLPLVQLTLGRYVAGQKTRGVVGI